MKLGTVLQLKLYHSLLYKTNLDSRLSFFIFLIIHIQGLEPVVSSGNPVDYSTAVAEVDEVVTLDHQQFEDRREVLPLNLATSSPTQVHTTEGKKIEK